MNEINEVYQQMFIIIAYFLKCVFPNNFWSLGVTLKIFLCIGLIKNTEMGRFFKSATQLQLLKQFYALSIYTCKFENKSAYHLFVTGT